MLETSHSLHTVQGVFRYIAFVFACAGIVWLQPLVGSAVILMGLGVYVLSHYLTFGLYVMVILSMMTEWKLSLSAYPQFFHDYPSLLAINAPMVDIWVVLLLVAFGVAYVRAWLQGKEPQLVAPGVFWYGLFLVSAFLSFINLPTFEWGDGIKFFFRFLVFLYVGYVVLGVNICTKKEILLRALRLLAFVGMGAAVMGGLSLFLGLWEVGGFTRAVPFALFGWAPFGYQHILLAEIVTTTLPIAVFFYLQDDARLRSFWGTGAVLMLLVAILTLSRAALLTIGVEAGVLLYFFRDNAEVRAWASKHLYRIVGVSIVSVLALFYAAVFVLTNPTVSASSEARSYMTDIALYLFSEHPVFGNGVGSYVTRLSNISVFRLEFGDPLEAHGMVQKILSEQGMLGLITFVLFFVYILSRLKERYAHEHYTAEARFFSLLGFFLILSPVVFQLFNTQYYSSKMWIPIMLALAQFTLYKTERKHGKVFQGDIQRRFVTE